ncbi:putative DegT/DnrJ/EryC1/StrS family aminotransferase protein [Maribacter sp. HTCC2170]|nr:putative DegT/DnrJ/EryC1/StrS family aminotransferase protein [Maribacter sp. HTCC2170]
MGGKEQTYVNEAFQTNWVAPLGPNVDKFEEAIQSYLNNNVHVAALSTGTSAIHLALELLGVGKDDEVICQSFTFSASANPIMYLGATPIFVDSERDTWNIAPELVEKAITDKIAQGKKPKAIVAVHLYGMPYKINELAQISMKYDIPIVEDSAEAFGSTYHGINCGSFGDFGILSFNGNKIITTSGGGALVCHSIELKHKAVHLATQAREDAPHYQHSMVGYNYRMSNVLAGIGRGQMEVLDDRVGARRSNFEFYYKKLNHLMDIEFLQEPDGFFSNRWLTCILTSSFELREKIRKALLLDDVETRPLWKPMHMQPVFEKYPNYTDGTSEDLFDRGLCLPSGSNLSIDDLERITTLILKEITK